MKKPFKIILSFFGFVLLAILGALAYVTWLLPNTGPAPELTIELTPKRIQRGAYLANHVTVCVDCHSTRDWSRFAGPIVPGSIGGGGEKFGTEMGFPGDFYSKNITPHALFKWTDGELYRAITTGVSKDGSALFPVMPYQSYGQMDPEDIYSIIAYLRQLPSSTNVPPASKPAFPVNILINTMPVRSQAQMLPVADDELAYGQYLINAASCVDCHSQVDKGTPIPGTEYGGGMAFPMPGGIVRSANLTPDVETGLGQWTEAMFVNRFKMYADSAYSPPKVAPGDLNTPMPWNMYAGMTDTDLKAIYAYLRSLKPIHHKVDKYTKL
ncbi:cytochrome c [Dyadobacter jejuensis]|uniref:Cytochrome c n=1 Tax=Dyadobacter jejuensis TaxID=1082580 RepID=A0A316AEG9_9BACT|nr:c-type cytochrome [Dyadobacter jejuensis]PWJ56002.1 cytochrome c [Dyadobacter jejuensis]